MKNYELIPNKSFGIFIIGNKVENYFDLKFICEKHEEKDYTYYSYEFENYIETTISVQNGVIDCVMCDKYCCYNGENLIGMDYNHFVTKYNLTPDTVDQFWIYGPKKNYQNQYVYEFNDLGLQIWVWRGRIRSVTVSNYQEGEGK